MRILAITHQYPHLGNDGLGPYNRHQLRWLAQEHEVEVVAPIPWTTRFRAGYENFMAQPQRYRNKDGIWVHHPVYVFPPKLLMHRYGKYFLSSVRKAVGEIVERFRPDVIFSCWAHPDGWAAVRLGREHGLPVLIKVIGSDVLVLARDPQRRQRIAEALREADGVAAVSQDLADHVIGLGVDASRVRVVPEGINLELFCPGDQSVARARLNLPIDGPKRLLFVGNLLLSKGAGVLLEACALLRQRGVEFRCHLVGRGRDEPRLRGLSERLGLGGGEGVVEFVGPCAQWQLPDWYRACDLVVLPSFSEGIPNVLREGMMCGTGFVATKVGGIPEITRPEVGRLVEAGDPRQLAEAVEKALAEGLRADRATALELNISWEQSARMMVDGLRGLQQASHPPVAGAFIRAVSREENQECVAV
jgi:glycosyltransferase involved in cell wall biosynthesis